MTIRLENLIPLPLLEQERNGSGIWEQASVVFESGESYLVEAPSGRGKTSLLSVIFGIRDDYRGQVFFDDRDISTISAREWSFLRKEQLSFIFQGLELFPELSGWENIRLKNMITGYRSDQEIRSFAERLEIGAFLQKKAGILSFGQQQRVAIIRALCQPFRFLLADECFSHMDHEISRSALVILEEECRKQDAGMIMTSLSSTNIPHPDKRYAL